MTVDHVNVSETIQRILKEISQDKSISPALASSIELLMVVIQMLLDRQKMNSSKSSLPPRSDQEEKIKKLEKRKVTKVLVAKRDTRE